MGECGCASGGPDFRINLGSEPAGLTIYPGCDDCETPIGVCFDRLDFMSEADIESIPEITLNEQGVCTIKVLDPAELLTKLREVRGICDEDDLEVREVRRAARLAVTRELI